MKGNPRIKLFVGLESSQSSLDLGGRVGISRKVVSEDGVRRGHWEKSKLSWNAERKQERLKEIKNCSGDRQLLKRIRVPK